LPAFSSPSEKQPQGSTWFIIPAGGTSNRFKQSHSPTNKLTEKLEALSVIETTLKACLSAPSVSGLVVVGHSQYLETYQGLCEHLAQEKPIHWVPGGETRRESVYQGLLWIKKNIASHLPPKDDSETPPLFIGVHDAARPLLQPALIEAGIKRLETNIDLSGVVVGIPVKDTLKQVFPLEFSTINNPRVSQTPNRTHFWRAQTPQLFKFKTLLKAHQQVSKEQEVTDDAQLIELAELGTVEMMLGSETNLKITTPEDLLLARYYLKSLALGEACT
jgi:2-C-methyl-D-erythritol 4-phosphate cytidylyltransferase